MITSKIRLFFLQIILCSVFCGNQQRTVRQTATPPTSLARLAEAGSGSNRRAISSAGSIAAGERAFTWALKAVGFPPRSVPGTNTETHFFANSNIYALHASLAWVIR
jgi:hypothetical protein